MAITVRKGYESQFDINKMLPGEFAITTDTHKVYVCMAAGVSKELASVEELRNILDASDEAFEAFQELINAMEDGAVVTGLLNDVSNLKSGNYTISFSEAEERNNIESTDTIKVILGKIKKFFSSLSEVAFSGNYNDISNTPDLSDVASTGKSADVTYDNSNSGLVAKDVQGAIDEVSEKTVKNVSDISVLNTKLEGIGTFYSGNGSNTSVPSGTSTPVASVKLPKGVYVLTGFVRFNANENGYRYANFNTTSGASSQQVNDTHPNANYVTQLNLSMCVSVAAETTMYLNAYQNSGSDLTCPSGGTFIRVVKVA